MSETIRALSASISELDGDTFYHVKLSLPATPLASDGALYAAEIAMVTVSDDGYVAMTLHERDLYRIPGRVGVGMRDQIEHAAIEALRDLLDVDLADVVRDRDWLALADATGVTKVAA